MRLVILALLLIPFAFGTHAQPTSNKPRDNSPFKEDSQTNQPSCASDGARAITFEPTLILKGVIGSKPTRQ